MSWHVKGAPRYPFLYSELPEYIDVENDEDGRVIRYVPERTCTPELPEFDGFPILTAKPHCSECGFEWHEKPSYCQSCGAKVVD